MGNGETTKQRSWLVAVAYGLLVIALTYPLVAQLGTHVPGEPTREDLWVHLWTFDWIREALASGANPLHTTRIFFPAGASLASHNIAWLNIAAWLPLQALVGPIAAYNVVFLLIYWLNCWATFLFARAESGSTAGAFLAGIGVGFWPYLVSHLDHPNLIPIAWVPLAMLALHHIYQRRRLSAALWLALFLFLLGVTRWQLLLLGGLAIGFYAGYGWWRVDRTHRRRAAGLVLLGGGLAGAALLPLFLFVARDVAAQAPVEALLYHELSGGQVDLLAYLIPNRFHPLWREWVAELEAYRRFRYNRLYTPSLLVSALPLILLGLRRRGARFWLGVALFYFVMSLGSILRLNGELYPDIPLPYRLVENNMLFAMARRPDRYNIMLGLPLALLMAHGVAYLEARLPRRRQIGVVSLAVLFLVFEVLPVPYPLVDTRIVPAGYGALPVAEERYAIVDVPLARIPIKLSMYYQLSHRHPLVQGRIARGSDYYYAFIDSVPFLRDLYSTGTIAPDNGGVSRQLARLAENDVRFLVLQRTGLELQQSDALRDWLPYAPYYEDAALLIYTTAPERGREYTWRAAVAPGVGVVATTWRGADGVRVTWDAAAAVDETWRVCFQAPDGDRLPACAPLPPGRGLYHTYHQPAGNPAAGWELFLVDGAGVALGDAVLLPDPAPGE